MVKGIIGKKVGMTQLFDANGKVVPVTVIEAGPCTVVQKKTSRAMATRLFSWASARFPPRRSTRQLQATSRRQTLPPRRPCASSVWKMFPQ